MNPPCLSSGKRHLHPPSGDTFSSSESERDKSQLTHSDGHAQINRTASAPLPSVAPDPTDREDFFSTKSNSAKYHGEQKMEEVPPRQRPHTDSQIERHSEKPDAEFRERFRPTPYDPPTATDPSTISKMRPANPQKAGPITT